MKKPLLFLFLISCLTFSCSSDDGPNDENELDFRVSIDGAERIFDTVAISVETYEENGVEHLRKHISASISSSPAESIYFYITDNDTGSDVIKDFLYTQSGAAFTSFDNSFITNVTVSTNQQLKATFSGSIQGFNTNTNQEETLNLSGGTVLITIEEVQ